jgi:hypothetical protein
MAFKIKNFYQQTSPLKNNKNPFNQDPLGILKPIGLDQKNEVVNNPFGVELTHSGNPIPEGTQFYGSEDMEPTRQDIINQEIDELLNSQSDTNFKPNFDFKDRNFDLQKEIEQKRSGRMPEGNQNELIEEVVNPKVDTEKLNEFVEKMKVKSDPSKVKWSEAPPLGTQERTQWYIDNNLKLDKTTPPLAGADPEPIDEVMTSSVPKARNNRRTRRADRIKERNIQAELRRKGIKGNAKEGLIDGSFTIDDQDFQDPTVA